MVETEVDLFLNGATCFLSQRNMALIDQSVSDIFGMMLGINVEPVEMHPQGAADQQSWCTAIVLFSGVICGSCGIRFTSQAARAVTSAMLGGTSADQDSESIDDAVGEFCNMLAGGWKSRVPELKSKCLLSLPAVTSGTDSRIHVHEPSLAFTRNFSFLEHIFQVTMICNQPFRG